MSSKFKVDRARLLKVLGTISFRDKLDRRVLIFSPQGLDAFENSSSSAFGIVKCSPAFFEVAPDNDFAMIVSDGFKAGLDNMAAGVVEFTVEETGQGKQVIRMAETSLNDVEKTSYEEPVQEPQGDEAVFPIETGVAEDGSFELRMKAPKVLTAIVDSLKLQQLHKSNIERYKMSWKTDGTLFVATEIKDGGVLKKTISVNYISTPTEDIHVDIEPTLFQSQLKNFQGEVRITVHVTDTVRGITMTQRSGDHDVGYTLIGMNPTV